MLPKDFINLMLPFAVLFSQRLWQRVLVLVVGAHSSTWKADREGGSVGDGFRSRPPFPELSSGVKPSHLVKSQGKCTVTASIGAASIGTGVCARCGILGQSQNQDKEAEIVLDRPVIVLPIGLI